LVLQAARRDGEAASAAAEDIRLGFTVTRKVGNAVQRNRARRRLRAASALMADHAAPGYDYVLIGRAGTLTRPFAELGEDLTTALKKLGLYLPGSGAMKGSAER
jgi:ribonuclease P protein component